MFLNIEVSTGTATYPVDWEAGVLPMLSQISADRK
jgi:hypothetical protein